MENKSQSIGCSVTSCRFNAQGSVCNLNRIEVKPKHGISSGQPEESMCGSYRIEG